MPDAISPAVTCRKSATSCLKLTRRGPSTTASAAPKRTAEALAISGMLVHRRSACMFISAPGIDPARPAHCAPRAARRASRAPSSGEAVELRRVAREQLRALGLGHADELPL